MKKCIFRMVYLKDLHYPTIQHIYFEEFINIVNDKCQFTFQSYQFADDIAVILEHKNTIRFLKLLEQIATTFNLQINNLKSGIFLIHNHSPKIKELISYPIVEKCRYLGIVIKCNGKLIEHIKQLKQKISFLLGKLIWFSQKCSWKSKLILWKTYVAPHILYSLNAIQTQKYRNIFNQVQKIYKSSLKKLTGFPRNLPNVFFQMMCPDLSYLIIKHNNSTVVKMNERNIKKDIPIQYAHILDQSKLYKHDKKIINYLPKNFNRLFKSSHLKCKIHQCRLSFSNIIECHSKYSITGIVVLSNCNKYNRKGLKKKLEKLINTIDELES